MNNFAYNEISDMATVSSIDFVSGVFTIMEILLISGYIT
jgi:hypothetical protein